MHWKIVILVLPIIVLLSGCTLLGGIESVLQISTPEQYIGDRDVIVLRNVRTNPSGTVFTEENVMLNFIIQNRDVEKAASNVYVELYDSAILKCGDSDGDGVVTDNDYIGTTAYCRPVGNTCSSERSCAVLPLGEQQIFYNLVSPKDSDIGGITSTVQLSLRVVYSFSGGTRMDLVIANMAELERAERTGKTMQATSSKSYDSGPVEIQAELLNRDYAISGMSASIRFLVKDTGSYAGSIKGSEIAPNSLIIDFSKIKSATIIPPGTNQGGITIDSNTDTGDTDDRARGRVTGFVSYNGIDIAKIFNSMITGMASGISGNAVVYDAGTGGYILNQREEACSVANQDCDTTLYCNQLYVGDDQGICCYVNEEPAGPANTPLGFYCAPAISSSDATDAGRGRDRDDGTGTTDTGTTDTGSAGTDIGITYSSSPFKCGANIATGVDFGCINIEKLSMINGQSSPLVFKINNLPSVDIFQTFQILATIRYNYEVRDSVNIQVKPYGD
ncbi:MAG: hypothetical protein ABIG30_00405 [Candidatus Aenigmatarchaeota archaeon]